MTQIACKGIQSLYIPILKGVIKAQCLVYACQPDNHICSIVIICIAYTVNTCVATAVSWCKVHVLEPWAFFCKHKKHPADSLYFLTCALRNWFAMDIFRVTPLARNLISGEWNKHIHGNWTEFLLKGANRFSVKLESSYAKHKALQWWDLLSALVFVGQDKCMVGILRL